MYINSQQRTNTVISQRFAAERYTNYLSFSLILSRTRRDFQTKRPNATISINDTTTRYAAAIYNIQNENKRTVKYSCKHLDMVSLVLNRYYLMCEDQFYKRLLEICRNWNTNVFNRDFFFQFEEICLFFSLYFVNLMLIFC